MPTPYDPERVLNLRVAPELRARLDALVERLAAKAPPGARVTRHSLAVDALTRGLDAIERAEGGAKASPKASPRRRRRGSTG